MTRNKPTAIARKNRDNVKDETYKEWIWRRIGYYAKRSSRELAELLVQIEDNNEVTPAFEQGEES